MSRKQQSFTPEQIRILEENPYTDHMTQYRLNLTVEAKVQILEMVKQGLTCCQITKALGYDLDIIGEKRAYGMILGAKDQAKSERGLRTGYPKRVGKRLDPERVNNLPTNPETFAKLINEVFYLKCTPCQVQNLLSGISSATGCGMLLPLCRC